MAKTGESKIKDKVRDVLIAYGAYYFMPVQFGYGRAGLDFHCCILYKTIPIAFFVETKDVDKTTTKRQDLLIEVLRNKYKAKVFIIDDEYTLKGLEQWLQRVRELSQLTQETQGRSTGLPAGSAMTK